MYLKHIFMNTCFSARVRIICSSDCFCGLWFVLSLPVIYLLLNPWSFSVFFWCFLSWFLFFFLNKKWPCPLFSAPLWLSRRDKHWSSFLKLLYLLFKSWHWMDLPASCRMPISALISLSLYSVVLNAGPWGDWTQQNIAHIFAQWKQSCPFVN